MHKRALGSHWEKEAESFLKIKGLTMVARNFTCRYGEVDLIMQDGECLVFAEVRYRTNSHFGSAAETVTTTKQRRIINTAAHFLQLDPKRALQPCRFDVISIDKRHKNSKLNWIKNAFTADRHHH